MDAGGICWAYRLRATNFLHHVAHFLRTTWLSSNVLASFPGFCIAVPLLSVVKDGCFNDSVVEPWTPKPCAFLCSKQRAWASPRHAFKCMCIQTVAFQIDHVRSYLVIFPMHACLNAYAQMSVIKPWQVCMHETYACSSFRLGNACMCGRCMCMWTCTINKCCVCTSTIMPTCACTHQRGNAHTHTHTHTHT